jgi:hypothetical protein
LRGVPYIFEWIACDEVEDGMIGGLERVDIAGGDDLQRLNFILELPVSRFQLHRVAFLDSLQHTKVSVAMSGNHAIASNSG